MSPASQKSRLFLGIASTFLSRIWNLVAIVALSPFYIHFLGASGYAVISLAAVILAIMSFLDSGLTPLAMREMADDRKTLQQRGSTLFHFELIYAGIALTVCLAFLVLVYGAGSGVLGKDAIVAIKPLWPLVCIDVVGQMIVRFYVGCLQGFDRHIGTNLVLLMNGICRGALVIPLLLLSPSLNTFFGWQALVSLAFMWLYRKFAHSALGASAPRNRISLPELRSILAAAMALSLVGIAAVLFGQLDKLVFVRTNSLVDFAAYSFAASLAAMLPSLALVLFSIFLSKYVRHRSDPSIFNRLYASTFSSVAILSSVLAAQLICYSESIHQAVFHASSVTGNARTFAAILAIGGFFSSLTVVPYAVSIVDRDFFLQGKLLVVTFLMAAAVFPLMHHFAGAYWIPIAYVSLQVQFSILYVVVASRRCVGNSMIARCLGLSLVVLTTSIGFTIGIRQLVESQALLENHEATILLALVSGATCFLISAIIGMLGYRVFFKSSLIGDLASFSEVKAVAT